MPHFTSKNMFVNTNTTFNIDNDTYRVSSYLLSNRFPNLRILPIIGENEVIFVRCIQREGDYLYKVDNLTRHANLQKTKDLLAFLSKDLDEVHHNLHATTKHSKGMQNGFLLYQENLSSIEPDIIEIGFGSGRHLLDLAKKNPQKILLGFEIYQPSIRQVLNAIELNNLQNLYVCNLDARLGIEMFKTSSIESIYLHFPVPWNKAKHRRVMGRDFVENSFRILKHKGFIDLRSDDLTYVQDCIEEMLSANRVSFAVRKNLLKQDNIASKYEERWVGLNKDIYEIRIFNEDFNGVFREEDSHYFDFDFKVESLLTFSNQKWVENGIFISIGDVYTREGGGEVSVAQLTFGSFYIPFNTYLILEQDKMHYLRSPVNVKSHRLAHEFLCRILKGEVTKG